MSTLDTLEEIERKLAECKKALETSKAAIRKLDELRYSSK